MSWQTEGSDPNIHAYEAKKSAEFWERQREQAEWDRQEAEALRDEAKAIRRAKRRGKPHPLWALITLPFRIIWFFLKLPFIVFRWLR